MNLKTWITIFNTLNTIALLIWVVAALAVKFEWFHENFMSENTLETIYDLSIIAYVLLLIVELRLKVKYKDGEIAKLKTKLLKYEH